MKSITGIQGIITTAELKKKICEGDLLSPSDGEYFTDISPAEVSLVDLESIKGKIRRLPQYTDGQSRRALP